MAQKGKHIKACALTVAGSDSGGSAGVEADLLSFAAFGVHGCAAVAALTAQNPDEVRAVAPCRAAFLLSQLECVADYYPVGAAKTGMLFNAALVKAAAKFFAARRDIKLVVDPVMISTSRARLLKDSAVKALENELLPLAHLATPNLDEAKFLLGKDFDTRSLENTADAFSKKYGINVLLKGGHLDGDRITDVLHLTDGSSYHFRGKRVANVNTHGSGCTLSAAIAANLALSKSLPDSCKTARKYIVEGMRRPLRLKENFINHLPQLEAYE